MSDGLRALTSDVIAEAVTWRHHLHQHPELAYREQGTSDFVAAQLTRFGFAVHRGLAGTGVVGTLSRGTSRRTLGIRADMDALRVSEKSNVPYASSVPGVMHACGHDGHVAIALAAARLCTQLEGLDGTVHFIFQPAEEGGAGARRMMEQGLFQLFPCDSVYALHNWPALPQGSFAALDGVMMAANAVFEIEFSGRGCHGAMPYEGTDCIVAGAQFVSAVQSVVSRNLDPQSSAVVSMTQFHAGEAHNVLPDKCVISGTTRWFDDNVGNIIEQRMREIAGSIAKAFQCEARVHYERRYPAVLNDPVAAQLIRAVASRAPVNLTRVDARPSMGAEDFAFMLQAVPGCYLWLGAGTPARRGGLHSSEYDFNDDLLPLGAALWTTLVQRTLTGT